MRRFLLLFAALGLLSGSLQAATTLYVGPSRTYTTIQAALTAAATGDIIEVDSGTYTEALDVRNKAFTLRAAADADVTIVTPAANSKTLYMQNCPNVTIKGASASLPLKIVANGSYAMQSVWGLGYNMLVEDVEFLGTTNAYAVEVGATNSRTVTLNRCRFKVNGGYSTVYVSYQPNVTFNDCNWDQCVGSINAIRFKSTAAATVRLNRCNVYGYSSSDSLHMSGWPAFFFEDVTPATIVATDCNFGYYYDIFSDSLATVSTSAKTVRLINPTFATPSAPPVGRVFNVYKGATCSIEGTTASLKTDLRSMSPKWGYARIASGKLLVQDCILGDSEWDDKWSVYLLGDGTTTKALTVNRCLIPSEGVIGTFNATAGSGAATINLNDSIVKFADKTINTSAPSVDALNLNHCTLLEGAAVTGAVAMQNGAEDMIVANYSIFNAADVSNNFSALGFLGSTNIVNHASGSGFGASIPGDTVLDNPQLDSDGLLTAASLIAAGKAVGSTSLLGFNGQSRQLAATTPDIGADESSIVPVELSAFDLL